MTATAATTTNIPKHVITRQPQHVLTQTKEPKCATGHEQRTDIRFVVDGRVVVEF